MVVQDPLEFDLILRRDYVYSMRAIVSTLFRVIYFPHNGRVVTIDQLSFVGTELTINPMASLNDSYIQAVSLLLQVNYVVLSLMPSVADEDEPLTISSVSYDLDMVVDMVISLIGSLEFDLLTPVTTLNMVSFQCVFLLSSEYLLEAMTKFCPFTWCPFRALSSWKP
jgi:hypothetical protein